MTLVYSDYIPADKDTFARHQAAMQTWQHSGMRLLPFASDQNSRQIGDHYAFPFIRDMFDAAFESGDENIAVIANNDVQLFIYAETQIRMHCEQHGCFWAYRQDSNLQIDGGIDLIAVTRMWWFTNREIVPDLLFGCRAWDVIMKELMERSGCMEGPRCYWHPPHTNDHRQRLHAPSAKYNEAIWYEWNANKAVMA